MFAQQARDKAAATAGNQHKDLLEVTYNDCGEKCHYQLSPVCPEQKKLKEDAEKYRSSQSKTEPGSKTTEAKQAFMHGIDSFRRFQQSLGDVLSDQSSGQTNETKCQRVTS